MRLALALLAALATLAFDAAPAAAETCGVSGSTTQSIGNYNPFTGGINQATAHLTLTRRTSVFSATERVNFALIRPADAPAGLDIRYQGESVLRSSPNGPRLSVTNPPSGTLFHDFGPFWLPNTVTLDLAVTIPGGLDLRTGQSIRLDIVYVCSGSGLIDDVESPAILPQAITLRLNVLSALQASYAGPALDFGEIGDVSSAQAAEHSATGALRIASSGPYYLSMSSVNGYRMTYPGGNPAIPEQSIRYSATLLGQTRSNASATFSPVYCAAAGIAGEMVPLTVRLQDGGSGKTPSPDYRDTLTITVTPGVALPWPPPANC